MTTRCRHCGRELPTKDFALPGHRPMLITMPCDCPEARAEQEGEEREIERRERAKAFSEVWMRMGIPDMFTHVDADFEAASTLLGGGSLYLQGMNGRGKTHAACRAAKAYLVRNTYRDRGVTRCWKSASFVTAQDLFSQLKTAWDRWDQTEEDVYQRWVGVDLLVLDDLGKGVPSEWAAENLLRLVDSRWSNMKAMVITSQYTIEDLEERYRKAGEKTMRAMYSRLAGWCKAVSVVGEDRRISERNR